MIEESKAAAKSAHLMSAFGTSATFPRRDLMSGSKPFSDISAWPVYVTD
jgi:hypothetical protein